MKKHVCLFPSTSLPVIVLLLALCAWALAGVDLEKTSIRTTRDITINDAVQIGVRQNPDVLRALQEIQRTRGLVIEVRAQALPQITVSSNYTQQSPTLLKDGGGSSTVATTTQQGTSATTATTASTTPATSTTTTTTPTTTGTTGTVGTVGTAGTGTTTASNSSTAQNAEAQSSTGGSLGAQDKSWTIIIEGRQLLYSGGQVSAALRIAKFAEDSSYWSLRDTVDTFISNVRKQFYTVLLNRALITVQEESIRLLESQLSDQENRYRAGTVPRFNVLQAEVALANARPALILARNNYNIAELQLARLLGINYESAPTGMPPINPIGELTTAEQPLPLDEAIELAKEQRPFLKVQRQQILINVENIKVALAGYQPQLEANGGYEIRNSHLSNNLDDTVHGWFFGFTGTWNIFDGFATYGRTKQAKAQLEEARVTYDDSVRQVELEVQQALDTVREATQTLASQTKAVQEAEEAVRLATERLNAGAGTQLDVLNAQVALTQARTTAYQARSDYNTAMAEFDRVTARDTRYEEMFDDPLTRKKRAADQQRPVRRAVAVEHTR